MVKFLKPINLSAATLDPWYMQFLIYFVVLYIILLYFIKNVMITVLLAQETTSWWTELPYSGKDIP
jgi:hypothetical protein